LISLPQLPGHDLLTHSRMQCYKQCPRKHLYRYELGVRPDGTAKPLRIGSAVHEGIDYRAKGASILDAINRARLTYGTLTDGSGTAIESVTAFQVEEETVAALLAGYFWYWEGAELPPELRVQRVIESEGSFVHPIKNPDSGMPTPSFKAAGKRDAIVELGDGRIAVKETKTCKEDLSPTSDYWRRLELDSQISGYLCAAHEMGHAADTVLYDVIRKPSIAPKLVPVLDENGLKIVLDRDGNRVVGKKGQPRQTGDSEQGYTLQQQQETPQQFGARLLEDICERPSFYYARREIPRLIEDLDEYRRELWQIQQQMRESQKQGRWFRNTGACLTMGRCEYLNHCRNGIDPASPPAGFSRVADLHPELQENEDA
jgi:hypothetical protein